MPYNPDKNTKVILDAAMGFLRSVPYKTTARWVFYQLLQNDYLEVKKDYKRLLGYLSKARKEFYDGWRPDTLADDTRAPILMQRTGYYTLHMRGLGFKDVNIWHETVTKELNCPLDRWPDQPAYVEVWFEAAAMQSQFLYYCHESIPLLAFHGDVSIPAKWDCTLRIVQRWNAMQKPISILYYGDYDPKGLLIPESARKDVEEFACIFIASQIKGNRAEKVKRCVNFLHDFNFVRVGINEEHIEKYNVPENPERPGTYQWEALSDEGARELIQEVYNHIDTAAFDKCAAYEDELRQKIKRYLESWEFGNEKPENKP
jgi:hypothetical protein